MTSRERVKTLLAKEIPDRIGTYEHFWPETLSRYWPEEGYSKDTPPTDFFDYDILNAGGWFKSEAFLDRREIIEETDEWSIVKDGRGATLKHWKKKSGTPEHIAFEVTSPEAWKKYREPYLETKIERLGDLAETKRLMAAAREKNRFSVFGNLFIYEHMRGTIGDANFLPALLLEKEWIHDFNRVYLDFYKRHYELLFREVGLPDGFWIFEDFGYNKGLFCSPDTYREMVMPYEKEFVGFLHDYGLPVLLHSCGDIRKAMPLIVDAGFDCIQPMEAKAGCDVVRMAEEYGRKISYMGNINIVVLETNDRKKIREEITGKIEALRKMRIPYFFHSDHSIPPTVRLETYRYALDLAREIGVY